METLQSTVGHEHGLNTEGHKEADRVLELQPITYADACADVEQYRRHHPAPQGHKFSIAVADQVKVVGVVMVGRPVARHLDNGRTLEVTRCCTDGTRNAPSKLYAAAWSAARAMGTAKL